MARTRNIIQALSILLLRYCFALNVVIEKSQCNKPLSDSAQIDGVPNRLSFTEYLDFVDGLIQADDDFRGKIDIQDQYIIDQLDDIFHTLAKERCGSVLEPEECSDDSIHIFEGILDDTMTPLQSYLIFSVCERTVEFVIEEVTSAAPSQSPSLWMPNYEVTVFNTIQVEVDVGIDNDPDEVADQKNVPASFETLVKEVFSTDTPCTTEFISSRLEEPGKKIPCEGESRLSSIKNTRICYEYIFATTFEHDGAACSIDILSVMTSKIDEASTNGLETILCMNEFPCTIAIMVGKDGNFLIPIVSGLAGAAFVFLAFMGYHGRRKRATNQHTNIEVAFPIPSLHEEEDPFEKEQTNPFEKEQPNPFEQSIDHSFNVSFR